LLSYVRDFAALTSEKVIEGFHRDLLGGELSFLITSLKMLVVFSADLLPTNMLNWLHLLIMLLALHFLALD
jgi:hypothetical protein